MKANSYDEFVKIFFDNPPKFLEKVVEDENRFYLLSKNVSDVKEKISRSVISSGLFLGEIVKREFYPSLALVDLMSKESDKKIVLDKKAAWLFLCGRDVFDKSIIVKKATDGIVFVQNQHDENLGIGVFKGKIVMNLLDKGDFLRREK
jgi:ribosome biogenesis protein Nip4